MAPATLKLMPAKVPAAALAILDPSVLALETFLLDFRPRSQKRTAVAFLDFALVQSQKRTAVARSQKRTAAYSAMASLAARQVSVRAVQSLAARQVRGLAPGSQRVRRGCVVSLPGALQYVEKSSWEVPPDHSCLVSVIEQQIFWLHQWVQHTNYSWQAEPAATVPLASSLAAEHHL